ncbi:MAG: F0F1 ATP synthase subunit delta [Rubrivivax sp.]|nr:F0F1 ATP synthase subunit delta [Rubrivivax sp.]
MAELATIARPYAEALFRSVAGTDAAVQLNALADVSADAQLRQFADNPKVEAGLVFNVVADLLGRQGTVLNPALQNLLRAVLDNGRLTVLPEIAAQYQALVNGTSGVSDALIESAYAIDDTQLADVVASLEKRFARKLNARVEIQPELIGGIRATVGDEVLDTSVKARLEQMKVALTA